MSLRWRFFGAFSLGILFTVLLSVGVRYAFEGPQLAQFSAKLRGDGLAAILSRTYTADRGWDNLERILVRTGFLIDPERIPPEKKATLSKKSPFGVVVTDADGNVILNTLGDQIDRQDVILGEPAPIRDSESGQVVGAVTIGIHRAFIAAETRQFLLKSLFPTAIGGLITAVIALLLAFWLARRITAPVSALTQATQALAESGDTQLLPVNSSDELGRMSASFNRMMAALQTQRDLRKRLITDVSHELNTPLTVIRLEAKGSRDGLKPPAEAADQIIEEVDRLGNLVHDLNWLAETDSGALRFNMEPHSLGALLTAEVERWQLQAQVAGIELVLLPLPPDLPTMQLDAVRMGQVLGNLIENALQHTLAGGRVTVRCQVADGWVEMACTEFIEVSVCDTGSGIAAEDLPFVFERFYRADLSRQRGKGGLGLSIVKQIVEAHQGQVWAESDLGKGSCFYFRLPLTAL